ncbi:MAG TPA: primosomal protein N' [Candidatus Egerieousia sp.]|nr:primosomal protein N' [Candidatus Egerieousia sp.]HPT05380.1 primosomal protein N' [Candidatus Egerieousia sp.]
MNNQDTIVKKIFISVILPIKFEGEVFYILPPDSYASPSDPSAKANSEIFFSLIGSRVRVMFGKRIHSGVIRRVVEEKDLPRQFSEVKVKDEKTGITRTELKTIEYKPILYIEDLPKITPEEIKFWDSIAHYYLCSTGEVFKAAYPILTIKQESIKSLTSPEKALEKIKEGDGRETNDDNYKVFSFIDAHLPVLSEVQQIAYKQIKEQIVKKPVLLEGVTGSGKTEIYIKLADKQLKNGKNVLYLVPEIAMSKQMERRLREHFGNRLFVFHSELNQAPKKLLRDILIAQSVAAQSAATPCGLAHSVREESRASGAAFAASGRSAGNSDGKTSCNNSGDMSRNEPIVILGTRSSLLLPFDNLGLIIIDEEHDASYKQTEPAPRYNARDSAIMLAGLYKAQVLMGSATPSLESRYNCIIGRFAKVELKEKYYKANEPDITVIDTIWTRRSKQMKGSFSQELINEIKKTIAEKGQVIVFRNIRSYSPVVQCTECGEIPRCPHCDVPLSYHKYDNTLRCHYCEYQTKFTGVCPKCGNHSMEAKGVGTEKLEEELKELFPEAKIARFDADIAKSKTLEDKVLKEFAEGNTDILVGTQMISKGFDFKNLNLVAVIQADTILGMQDFRADERAIQLFTQLMGRTGRRDKKGKFIIQTNQKKHPVIEYIANINNAADNSNAQDADIVETPDSYNSLLDERRRFGFPPYVRMVTITVRERDKNALDEISKAVGKILKLSRSFASQEVTGPFPPRIEKVRNDFLLCFNVKFARDKMLEANKDALKKALDTLKAQDSIIIDVDPL